MTKEITPEDIRKRYVDIESKLIKETLVSSIVEINRILLINYRHIIENNYFYISSRDLGWASLSTDRKKVMISYLKNFFKSWDVTSVLTDNFRVRFAPPERISMDLNIDMSEIGGEEKEVTPEDVINNRSDILDIRTEE